MGESVARRNAQASEWLDALLHEGRKPKTIREHERVLNHLFRYIEDEGGIRVDQVNFRYLITMRIKGFVVRTPVSAQWVNEFLDWLVKDVSDLDERGRKRNRAIYTLRLFFEYLVDQGVLFDNPMQYVEPAQVVKAVNHRKYLTPRESASLVRAAVRSGKHAPRNTAVILTLLRSGLRPSELCNLTVKDLDFENGWIIADGKTGRRSAPMTPGLRAVLRKYLRSPYYRHYCHQKGLTCLFPDDRGSGPLRPTSLNRLVKKLSKSAGIARDVTTYWTRHTFATDAYRSGLPFAMVSLGLGHQKLKNTEVYVHGREDRLRQIAETGPALKPLLKTHQKMLRRK